MSLDIGEGADFLDAAPLDGDGSTFALFAASVNSQNAVILSLANGRALIDRGTVPLGSQPTSFVVADFNGDGIVDIAFATSSSGSVDVRLGTSNGQFVAAEDSAPLPQSAPIVVDWNGDGVLDVFDLDQQGDLLMRLGQPGAPGEYDSPQIIGQYLGVSFSDIALVNTGNGPVLAALEQGKPVIWLFSHAQGPGVLIAAKSINVSGAGFLVSMTAGDLDDNGLDDLVLVDRGDDQLILLYQTPDGSFIEQGPALHVGYAPSEVAIANLNQSGWADLVVSNTYSGDISVFYGGQGRRFGPEVLLAAGLGATVVIPQDGGLVPHTTDEPIGVTTGVFDSSGLTDVVSVQSGADRISLLEGTPDGGLADPSAGDELLDRRAPDPGRGRAPDQKWLYGPRRPQSGEPEYLHLLERRQGGLYHDALGRRRQRSDRRGRARRQRRRHPRPAGQQQTGRHARSSWATATARSSRTSGPTRPSAWPSATSTVTASPNSSFPTRRSTNSRSSTVRPRASSRGETRDCRRPARLLSPT